MHLSHWSQKNANAYIQDLAMPKFIFVNNKPTAVLLSVDEYPAEIIQFDEPVRPRDILDEYNRTYGKKVR